MRIENKQSAAVFDRVPVSAQATSSDGITVAHLGPEKLWQRLLILALGYFALAELSLTLAMPPGYATALWPAAGLALGALLAWGWRCWPAVWLGSFAANLSHQALIAGTGLTPALLAVSALIGAGAALQAVTGARLIRFVIDASEPLWRVRDALYLLMLGGPLTCLISATFGAVGLHLLAALPADRVSVTWLTWWAGDTLGVLLFAPLVLLLSPQARGAWRANILQSAVPLLMTGAVLVAGYVWHNTHEEADHRERSAEIADDLYRDLTIVLTRNIGSVQALASLFDARENISRTEFSSFSKTMLGWSDIRAIAWIPRVGRAQLQTGEAAASSDGVRDLALRERDSRNPSLVPAVERSEYFEVLYFATRSGESAVPDFDAGATAASRAALQRATDSAKPVLVERAAFYGATAPRTNDWAIYVPVYRAGFDAPAASREARRESLRGFAAGLFSADEISTLAMGHNGSQKLAFRLSNLSEPGSPGLLATGASSAARADATRRIVSLNGGDSLVLETWPIVPWQPGQTATVEAYLVASVLVALLAAVFALAVVGQGVRVAREVAERTVDLQNSEQRTRSLLDNTAAFIGELTPNGVITEVNRTAMEVSAQRRDDVIGKQLDDVYWFNYSATVQAGLRDAIRRARNGESVRYDLVAHTGENRFITIDFMLVPVRDAHNQISSLIASGIDISERKRIEAQIGELNRNLELIVATRTEALRRSEQRYASMFELAPDALVIVNAQGRIESINRQAEILFGYRVEELTGQSVEILIPDSERQQHSRLRDGFMAQPAVRRMGAGLRLVARKKDGSTVSVDILLGPLEADESLQVLVAVRDVSERVRLEGESARQREILQRVVDNIPVMVCYISSDGVIQWVNRHYESVLGWSLEEARRLDILQECYPDPRERERVMRFILSAEETWGDFQTRAKDGRSIHTSWSNVLLSDGANIGFGLDMTQRRQDDAALRESEARFASAFEFAAIAKAIVALDGSWLKVNRAACTLTGYSEQELLTKTFQDITYRDDLDADLNFVEEILAGQRETYEMEKRYIHKQGHVVWALLSVSLVRDAQGQPLYFISQMQDITARKRAEAELREHQDLLSTVQSLAHLGYWSWDPETGELAWSDELYRIFGIEAQNYSPSFEDYLDRVHPEDRDASRRAIESVLEHGSGFQTEERILRPGGEVRYLLSYGETVEDASGRTVKVFGGCLDVTERQQSERALRQAAERLRVLSQRLADAQETERRALAAELHDNVGQNLTALGINLDLIRQGFLTNAKTGIDDRIEDSLSLVETIMERVRNVIGSLRPSVLDDYGLAAALRWYANLFERRTGIVVKVNAHGRPVLLSSAAETSLFRIVQEALTNSAKHGNATKASIDFTAEPDRISLEISDNGVGFDPDQHPRSGQRRGWGLTLMRERVEALGGRIEITATPGVGVSIAIQLRT